jgi:hypothetical protein
LPHRIELTGIEVGRQTQFADRIADYVNPPAASPAAIPRSRSNIQSADRTHSNPVKHMMNEEAN